MKKDIETTTELEALLRSFYEKAFQNQQIGHFFTEVVQLDLEKHLPHIRQFWESVIFNRGSYHKNVMLVHQHINDLYPISKEDLDTWVRLFVQTIDAGFEGSNAELMKQRAHSIATLMDMRLHRFGASGSKGSEP